MSLFLASSEKTEIVAARERGDVVVNRFWTALMLRTHARAASPGLLGMGEDAAWWYPAAEYLSDAAMAFALQPTEALAAWIRDVALAIARRPEADWVGPWFRDHATQPPLGHLETAHLCWGLGAALDLAADALTAAERDEIADALRNKGIALCRRWLDRNNHLANWRAVLTAGVAVAAAAVDDHASLAYAAEQTLLCAQAFQPDGSYAESLQYGNYLAYASMMAYEASHRAVPDQKAAGPEVYARGIPWVAASMLYARPLAGWDAAPRARAVNFNDCGAMFRPSGDLLLQVAARCRDALPREAGVARWLFDTYYVPVPFQGPHNVASFGLRNDWGFLTLPFLVQSAEAIAPDTAGLPRVTGFSNGNILTRDAWDGDTVLAIQGGGEPLCGPGHLHGDLNSFILAHRRERLLVDPGHSCYRNVTHGLESATQTHNTCTFLVQHDTLGLQEDLAKAVLLEQQNVPARRTICNGAVSAPTTARGRRLILAESDEVVVAGSDAASLYGSPIDEFSRFWFLAGAQVLFVVDRIRAAQPVTTIWNWLVNQRDGETHVDVAVQHTLVVRRRLAGMKLSHLAGGRLNGPVYAFVHDAYHPEPSRPGEGHTASGLLYRWIEPRPAAARIAVHAIALDDFGLIDAWEATADAGCFMLRRGETAWTLTVAQEEPLRLQLACGATGRQWLLMERDGTFTLKRD